MDKRRWIVIGCLIAVACVIACIAPGGERAEDEQIGVIVTIVPQADFVEETYLEFATQCKSYGGEYLRWAHRD